MEGEQNVENILNFAQNLAKNPTMNSSQVDRQNLLKIREHLFVGPAQTTSKSKKRPASGIEGVMQKRPCSPTSFHKEHASGDQAFKELLKTTKHSYYPKDDTRPSIAPYLHLKQKGRKKKSQNGNEKSVRLQDLQRHSKLGSLMLPIRRVKPHEKWSPREIAVFESGICIYGKEFHELQRLIKTKSTKEVVEFYYWWKKTNHHRSWKSTFEDPF